MLCSKGFSCNEKSQVVTSPKGTLVKRIILALSIALSATFTVTACAPAAEQVEVTSETMIIDVRTPQEFAEGHLEGAVNIYVQSPEFDSMVATLPTDGEYFIYCRSGNRSGQAISRMEAVGFTDMTNGGSVQEATNMTGIPVVK
jgi:phage shock protein E